MQVLPHCPELTDFRFSGTRSGRDGSAAVVKVSGWMGLWVGGWVGQFLGPTITHHGKGKVIDGVGAGQCH